MVVRPALLLALSLALPACTSQDARREAAPASPSADPCASAEPAELPASCVDGDAPFDTVASPTGSAPSSSAAIPAVTLPASPGDLASGGNDRDAAKTEEVFTVRVPAGQRLVTTAACEGRSKIQVVIVPASAAAQEFACGDGVVSELTVEDSEPVAAATSFTIRVTAPAPSRWAVAVGATDEPAPPAAQ